MTAIILWNPVVVTLLVCTFYPPYRVMVTTSWPNYTPQCKTFLVSTFFLFSYYPLNLKMLSTSLSLLIMSYFRPLILFLIPLFCFILILTTKRVNFVCLSYITLFIVLWRPPHVLNRTIFIAEWVLQMLMSHRITSILLLKSKHSIVWK